MSQKGVILAVREGKMAVREAQNGCTPGLRGGILPVRERFYLYGEG